MSNKCEQSDSLAAAIELLAEENERFGHWLRLQQPQQSSVTQMCSQTVAEQVANFAFLQKHLARLKETVHQLRDVLNVTVSATTLLPHSSTPYRRGGTTEKTTIDETAGGTGEMNRSVDAYKSDLSIGDISSWFHSRRLNEMSSKVTKRVSFM